MPAPGDPLSLALPFLRLGTIAFGGPAAHVAMMEDEFVRRRGWLTREELLDRVGAAGLLPGPSSTEVALFIGYGRAGWRGLLVAGLCFVLPAALLVSAIAWGYAEYGALPRAGAALHGVKAVVLSIVVQATVGLGRTALKRRRLVLVALLAAGASAAGVHPALVLLGAGLLEAAARRAGPATAAAVPLGPLFWVFLKLGAVVFGSGYVLLSFLRTELVAGQRWLTDPQLLDAVAVGQVTPGPVFTTATFIGWLLAGPAGAAVATAAIFLPSFLLVAASGPLIPRLRSSPAAAAFLDGVNAAAVALMAVVTVPLARSALTTPGAWALSLLALALLLRYRLNSTWLVAAGALAGLAGV